MKVEGGRPVGTGDLRKTGKAARGSDSFAAGLPAEEAMPAAAPVAAPAVSGLDALFALQEVPDALAERGRALAHGERILDRLEELRRGLLLGRIGRERLGELARLAHESMSGLTDPRLRELMGEIELRAQVELAKLQGPQG
jgi:hypothetical protein